MLAQALSTSAPASCSRGVQYRRKEHAQARPRVALGSRAVHGDAFATQSGQRRRHSLRKRFSVKAVISDRPPATEVQAEQKKSSGKFDWYNQARLVWEDPTDAMDTSHNVLSRVLWFHVASAA